MQQQQDILTRAIRELWRTHVATNGEDVPSVHAIVQATGVMEGASGSTLPNEASGSLDLNLFGTPDASETVSSPTEHDQDMEDAAPPPPFDAIATLSPPNLEAQQSSTTDSDSTTAFRSGSAGGVVEDTSPSVSPPHVQTPPCDSGRLKLDLGSRARLTERERAGQAASLPSSVDPPLGDSPDTSWFAHELLNIQ